MSETTGRSYENADEWTVATYDDEDTPRYKVQVVRKKNSDEDFGVRVCAWQPNGRYGHYAPIFPSDPDVINDLQDALTDAQELSERLNNQRQYEQLLEQAEEISPETVEELFDIVDKVGPETALERLQNSN